MYELPESLREGKDPTTFAISSRVRSFAPDTLRAAGVRATERVERLIDDGARGWRDWHRLNWVHPPLWHAATRKPRDPKWRGPDGAGLRFEIRSETENRIVVTVNCNAWGAVQPGKPALNHAVSKPLRASPDWQDVSVRLDELVCTNPKVTAPLADWQSVTELQLRPNGEVVRDGEKVRVAGQPWRGPREIRNLRWDGGQYAARVETGSALGPEDLQRNFNDAIRTSLEQEKLNGK